jgi:hypothetical protein
MGYSVNMYGSGQSGGFPVIQRNYTTAMRLTCIEKGYLSMYHHTILPLPLFALITYPMISRLTHRLALLIL